MELGNNLSSSILLEDTFKLKFLKLKKLLSKLFRPIAKGLGYVNLEHTSGDTDKNTLLKTFFDNVKSSGFTPKHIVDVGANHGTWTRETLKFFPDAYYSLLEPQHWLKDSFQDLLQNNPKIKFYPVGAGEKEGSFHFTIADRDDSCSFRYSKEEADRFGLKQIEIPVVTLNKLLAESDFPIPDIIKIDAEGLDIEVLNGVNQYFGKTEIFMVEAGVANKFFENSFLKLINYMDDKGYRLFEITDLNRPFDIQFLWLVELAFVKKGGHIDSIKLIDL